MPKTVCHARAFIERKAPRAATTNAAVIISTGDTISIPSQPSGTSILGENDSLAGSTYYGPLLPLMLHSRRRASLKFTAVNGAALQIAPATV